MRKTLDEHMGYLGHLSWMIGAYQLLGGNDPQFEKLSISIADALRQRLHNEGFCLETYPGERYVPDNVVVIAALANYSRAHGIEDSALRDAWVAYAKARVVEPKTGLLSFHLDPSCTGDGVARGSGAGCSLGQRIIMT